MSADVTKPAPPVKVRAPRGGGQSAGVRSTLSSPVASAVVVLLTVLWTIPTFGLFVSSLRPADKVQNSGWWTVFADPFSQGWTLNNYVRVLTASDFGTSAGLTPYLVNSFVISIPATLFPVAIACMAAYALAWIRFRGSDAIFFLIFALQVVPLQLALLPLLKIYSSTHIAGTFYSLWLSHTMFALPLATYLLHNFIAALPRELMEAAVVDGANHFTVFRRIVLPLSLPAIASFGIFQFLWVWNDLLVALTFGNAQKTGPITWRLSQLSGSLGSRWELLTAGAFVAIVVPLVVFFSLQRYFVRGLLAGSVKG